MHKKMWVSRRALNTIITHETSSVSSDKHAIVIINVNLLSV